MKKERQKDSTVLVVDDDKSILNILGKMIQTIGYSVKTFENPEVALSFVRNNRAAVNLLVTDYVMPEMTGTELIKAVKDLKSLIATIIITGEPGAIDSEAIKALDVDNVIAKPISFNDFTQQVAKLVY